MEEEKGDRKEVKKSSENEDVVVAVTDLIFMELRVMISQFRRAELLSLLEYVGNRKCTYMAKGDLLRMCLTLVKPEMKNGLLQKIKELHTEMGWPRSRPRAQPSSPSPPAPPPPPKPKWSVVVNDKENGRRNLEVPDAATATPCQPCTNSTTTSGRRSVVVTNGSEQRTVAGTVGSSTSANNASTRQQSQSQSSATWRRDPSAMLNPLSQNELSFIKMSELPFYEPQAVLLPPTHLIGTGKKIRPSIMKDNPNAKPELVAVLESEHSFTITPAQGRDILTSLNLNQTYLSAAGISQAPMSNRELHVQLRICALDPSAEEQDDLHPPEFAVNVNGVDLILPKAQPISGGGNSNDQNTEKKYKFPIVPVDITKKIRTNQSHDVLNSVSIEWRPDVGGKNYAVSINIVKRLTVEDLLQRLIRKGCLPPDFTQNLLKRVISKEDDELSALNSSMSLDIKCPIGKSRMKYPCRSLPCNHLLCFDALNFLKMNATRPKFHCPTCNRRLKFEDFWIDGYFLNVIMKLPTDDVDKNTIDVYHDGKWKLSEFQGNNTFTASSSITGPPAPKRFKMKHNRDGENVTNTSKISCVVLDDDGDDGIGCVIVDDNDNNNNNNINFDFTQAKTICGSTGGGGGGGSTKNPKLTSTSSSSSSSSSSGCAALRENSNGFLGAPTAAPRPNPINNNVAVRECITIELTDSDDDE